MISEELAIIFKETSVYEPMYFMRRKLKKKRRLDLVTEFPNSDVLSLLIVIDVVEGTFIHLRIPY